MGQPRPLLVYFRSFQQQFYRKIVDLSGIRTRIVGVEGEHADHLTTTTAQVRALLIEIYYWSLVGLVHFMTFTIFIFKSTQHLNTL